MFIIENSSNRSLDYQGHPPFHAVAHAFAKQMLAVPCSPLTHGLLTERNWSVSKIADIYYKAFVAYYFVTRCICKLVQIKQINTLYVQGSLLCKDVGRYKKIKSLYRILSPATMISFSLHHKRYHHRFRNQHGKLSRARNTRACVKFKFILLHSQ